MKISIYTYLQHRFGEKSYKTGAAFFILSRITGTSFRLFLLLKVLHWLVLDEHNIPLYQSFGFAIKHSWQVPEGPQFWGMQRPGKTRH